MSQRKVSAFDILRTTNAVISIYGWVSKKDSTEQNIATAELVTRILYPRRSCKEDKDLKEYVSMVRAGRETTDDNVARQVIAWIEGDQSRSDYMFNLQGWSHPAMENVVPKSKIALIASAIQSFKSNLKRTIENEKIYTPVYVGVVGERTDFELILIEKKELNAEYGGGTTIFKFTDSDRHLFVWFSSKIHSPDEFICGKVYKVKASIKAHKEFAGMKQTIISRLCKLK